MTNFKLSLLTCSILAGLSASAAYAEEMQQLEQIVVESSVDGNSIENIKEKKVGETKISAKKLAKQQASDSKDLVRYETGITVVETGRTGSSGYAVRGVDENRVGIMVDGLRQAETLSSQAFKELFEGYGNFNNTRNDVEIENVKTATITKGADSMKSGSGALGGSVMFDTKDARDYLIDKNYYLSVKRATQSMNSQDAYNVTAAGRYKWFDVLVSHTERDGNEIKNYGYENYDDSIIGPKREKADPYTITRRSTLVKFGFQPSENHRFAVAIDSSNLKSEGHDLSYIFYPTKYANSAKFGERRVRDSSKRDSIQFSYESFAQTPFWDHLKVTYSSQKITNKARSDEYCQGSQCTNIRNPSNLQITENSGYEITANGESINLDSNENATASSGGKVEDYRVVDATSMFLNCNVLDCSKKFNLYKKVYDANTFVSTVEKVSRSVTVKQLADNGGSYGVIEKTNDDQNVSQKKCYGSFCFDDITVQKDLYLVIPSAPGYYSSDYNDRDLNSKTKQINLDFDKEFTLFKQPHSLKYGGLYSETKKEMVNKQGWVGQEIQWWQKVFLGQNGTEPDPNSWMGPSSYKRAVDGARSSYLIPVKTKTTAFYLGDNFSVNDWLGFDLNWRYDNVKHLPNYRLGVDPEIPRGLIAGTMIPIPDSALSGGNGWYNYRHPDYIKNVQDNLNAIQRQASFKHNSYNLGINLDPTNWLRVQFKYSNGFRAPTSDEMYITFKHPQFSLMPNTNLKSETAKTKEMALTFYKGRSYFSTNVFQTDYKNFIDLAYVGERPIDEGGQGSRYPFYQSVNRHKAKVNGFEISTHLEIGDFIEKLDGFHLGYKLTYQKGRVKDSTPFEGYKEFLDHNPQYKEMALQDQPMNALQPTTSVYNFGYDSPSKKWGLDFYITDVAAKKAKDTFNPQWTSMVEGLQKDLDGQFKPAPARIVNGNEKVTDRRHLWRNAHYTIIDAIAYWKPIKNLTLTAGVYNLTDRKYLTWDSARSIRTTGTINRIETATGIGLNRFYAPGRNYRASIQFEF